MKLEKHRLRFNRETEMIKNNKYRNPRAEKYNK